MPEVGPDSGEDERPARRGPVCRPFTLLDAMIVVGGAAISFADCREWYAADRVVPDGPLYSVHDGAGSFLVVSSAVVLTLRLRGPRPPFRRIVRQPGTSACLVALVDKSCRSVDFLVAQVMAGVPVFNRSFLDWICVFKGAPGFTQVVTVVPITWMLLALGRRWRPEPGWIDRSGRIVGWCWIAWAVAGSWCRWHRE